MEVNNGKKTRSHNPVFENVLNFYSNPELDNIQSLTLNELCDSKPEPMKHILFPWLPIQGIAFVYAATGVGKTLFTLNVAYTISQGGNFLKYTAPVPRRVLYIDGEMAFNQLHSRIIDITKQQGLEKSEIDNFRLLTPDKLLPHRLPKICTPEGQDFYNKQIKKDNIEVIVLDNLSALSAIDDSSAEQWKPIQDWFIELRAQKKSVILVHHSGKDKKGYRGTSRMLDVIDTAISLQDVTQDQLENEISSTKKFKIEYQKNRSFGGKEAFPFEVSLTQNGWEYQSMEQNNTSRIAEMINMGLKQHDIAKDMIVSRAYVCKIVKQARRLGLIREGL